jgi:hypothetical protein
MEGDRSPQKGALEVKAEEFFRFREEYRRILESSNALRNPNAVVSIDQYFDTVMYAVGHAVPFMPLKRVGKYLCLVAERLSKFIGDADYGADLATTTDSAYIKRGKRFAHQMGIIMKVKDASFNGEGNQISLSTHNRNVGRYAARLAYEIGCGTLPAEEMRIAGETHDIGKLGISDDIIAKPGKLTLEEREKVEPHPVHGANVIRHGGFNRIADLVEVHHRWYDGQGYPKDPPVDSRDPIYHLLPVADVFDVVSRGRPYRDGIGAKGAMHILKQAAGTQLHPLVVGVAASTKCLVEEFMRDAA